MTIKFKLLFTLFLIICLVQIFFEKNIIFASSNVSVELEIVGGSAPSVTPTPQPTQTPIPTSTPTATSETNNCTSNITSGAPDLFEIRANENSATLYFVPPQMPYSSFYIVYSRIPDVWEYGTYYNQGYSSGVLTFQINLPEANRKYYFKIRAENGCRVGSWGNTMSVVTNSSQIPKTYYKNSLVEFVQRAKQVVDNLSSKPNTLNSLATQVPEARNKINNELKKQNIQNLNKLQTPKPKQLKFETKQVFVFIENILDKIKTFFTNLFKIV
ncbi:fibronectin type III domain-containing protein [Candidatus Dojkabacteria bacterium]|nr:fibronectin type III domain-containing protein [Candidatus Dojkabacteria bacterium]